MSRLYRNDGYVTQEGGTKYYLNICGPVPQCKIDGSDQNNIAACEVDIKTNNISVTGLTDYMTVLTKFDPMPGLSYSYPGRSKLNVSIRIIHRKMWKHFQPVLSTS